MTSVHQESENNNSPTLFIHARDFMGGLTSILSDDKSFFDPYLLSIELSGIELTAIQTKEAELQLIKAIDDCIAKEKYRKAINLIFCLNRIYLHSNDIPKSKELFDQYLSVFKANQNQKSFDLLNLYKGIAHFNLLEVKEAITIFSELLENSLKNLGKTELGWLYYWMASCNLWSAEWDMAINYLNACKRLAEQEKDIQTEVKCDLLLACHKLFQNDLNDCFDYLKDAYANLDTPGKELIEINLLSIYASINFINQEYNTTNDYLTKASLIKKNTAAQAKFYLLHKLKSESFKKQNQPEQTILSQNKCILLLESYSKIPKGKQALLNFPEFNCFESVINHTIQYGEYETSDLTPSQEDVSTLNILVIDDNKLNLFFTKKILSSQGYQTHIAASYNEVKRIIKNNEIELILLDIQMPKMNGYEMYQNLQSEKILNTTKTKVIAMTGYDSEKDKEMARKLGMDDYLVKPFTPEQLNALVRKIIDFSLLSGKQKDRNITEHLINKYGFNQTDTKSLLQLLFHHFKQASQALKQSLISLDCNKVLGISLDLKSNVQLIDHQELESLIYKINTNIVDKNTLSRNTALINQMINQLVSTQRKIETELHQFH